MRPTLLQGISAKRARAVIALVVFGVLAGAALAAETGQPAPDVSLRAADGVEQKLSALKGKVVYLDFWASWCVPCRQSFPYMNDLQSKFAGQDLVVLAVNLDAKREDADGFLARYPAKFRVAFDSDSASARQFGIKAMPTSYLIGRDGKVVAQHRGFRESQIDIVNSEIKEALAAK